MITLDITQRRDIIDKVLQDIYTAKSKGRVVNEALLDKFLKNEINNFASNEDIEAEDISNEDIETIRREVEYNAPIQHSTEGFILDEYEEGADWFTELEDKSRKDGEYWNNYMQYLIKEGKLDRNSLNKLRNETLVNLMNCLGDPLVKSSKQLVRRGLVVGDVQSGKTATYIGLMCKAADAGYKAIIVLAGTTESLRKQTQQRVEEGLIGYTIESAQNGRQLLTNIKKIGVGKFRSSDSKTPTSFASRDDDFRGDKNKTIATLGSQSSICVFVIKKNKTVLEKLYNWLKDLNANESDGLIHHPLLLLDDEADNASLNTRKKEGKKENDNLNPTAINKGIRKILNLFYTSTYVGFTATPFANVFIDPETTEEMENSDLFPENFIYSLPTPTTYVGAAKLFSENGACNHCIKYISDIDEPDDEILKGSSDAENDARMLYFKHKKSWKGEFPDSLTDSIRCFYLANVIRDLRGDMMSPRTMMINISRFTKVHGHITEHVSNIYNNDVDEIEFAFKDKFEDNSDNALFCKFCKLFEKHFSNCEFPIEKVVDKQRLYDAINGFVIKSINSNSADSLDYAHYPSMRCIAIGGLSLSRGLTLEGLMVSYFYRNTATFDVLMQMGRWFGYRRNYEDICQIWCTKDSASWYQDIWKASEELKDDISKMFDARMTPREFGLKVHDISDDLQITAANKMRSALDYDIQLSYWGNIFETPYINQSLKDNDINVSLVNEFFTDVCPISKMKQMSGSLVYSGLDKSDIVKFVNNLAISRRNIHFQIDQIVDFLEKDNDPKLESWDIQFVASSRMKSRFDIAGAKIAGVERTLYMKNGVVCFTNKGRLGGTSETALLLTPKQKAKAEVNYKNNKGINQNSNVSKFPSDTWFKYVDDRNPCLFIYPVKPKNDINDETENKRIIELISKLDNSPLYGFSIGLPKNLSSSAESKHYKITKDLAQQLFDDFAESDDDE